MTRLFSPFESYFDQNGRPTAAGQQLLAQIARLIEERGVPSGGTTGDVLAKASDADFDTVWVAN